MHLINTRLGAEKNLTRSSKYKSVPLGHPQLALAAQNYKQALVGHLSYRMQSFASTIRGSKIIYC
jgi:hypothetical protein